METVLILCGLLAPVVLASGKRPLGTCCAKLADIALSGRRFWPFQTLGLRNLRQLYIWSGVLTVSRGKQILVQVAPARPTPTAPHKGAFC